MTMQDTVTTYGLHLLMDCYGADPIKLDDLCLLYDTLDSLPDLIGMHKIGPPQMVRFTDPAIAGVSGVIMIVESHISIHTYSNKDFLSVDVYSCKQFDHQKVVSYIKQVYGVKEMDVETVDRGKKFPKQNLH
jgi:S-adenosylmethionine decarboxylase